MVFEKEYRKLEAEVGPIKYIAEFIYGDVADKNMLEEAVRWVIIMIIFVFDPLAVGLLIASQYAFLFSRGEGITPLNEKPVPPGKVRVIKETLDIDETPPEDIQALELEIESKLEK